MSDKKKRSKRELVGYCDVDAGLIQVGDPCYGADKKVDWNKFCDNLHKEEKDGVTVLKHDLGHAGKGIVVQSGYGDGTYPVYITRYSNGRIKSLTIKF